MKRAAFFLMLLLLFVYSAYATNLKQVEAIALTRAPELKEITQRIQSQRALAIAHSQWDDPTINLAAVNLPSDSFNAGQEPMTQFKIALKQAIPKGNSLSIKKNKGLANVQQGKWLLALKKLTILKNVRLAWFERYYWQNVRTLLLKQRATFVHLSEVTTSLYENGKVQQKDVFNARLQVAKIENKIIAANSAYQTTTVDLARWVGIKLAKKSHPKEKPYLGALADIGTLRRDIIKHPLMKKFSALLATQQANVRLAKENFKPGLVVDLSYGYRQSTPDGQKRADLVSLGLGLRLPVNTLNKQQKSYQAALSLVKRIHYQKQSEHRALTELLNNTYIEWRTSGDKLRLYREKILPQANNYAKASLISYQNAKLDFSTLANSYIELYQLEIAQEQHRLNYAKSNITLLFLNRR